MSATNCCRTNNVRKHFMTVALGQFLHWTVQTSKSPARTGINVCSGCQTKPSPSIHHGGNPWWVAFASKSYSPSADHGDTVISLPTVLASEEPRTPMPVNSEAWIEKRMVALQPSHSEQPYIPAADQTMWRSEKSRSETKRLINIEAAHAEVDSLYV